MRGSASTSAAAIPTIRALVNARWPAWSRRLWGVRWYWSVFKRGGLGLFPPQSLVSNVGADGLATNGTLKSRLGALLRRKRNPSTALPSLPPAVQVDAKAFDQVAWATFFRQI